LVLQDGLISGRFQLETEVGVGGMGTVYRGRDLQTNGDVAVKVLHLEESSAVERFEREATLLARVSHPGIVKYLDHGTTTDGKRYLVMEWINGETLARRLEREGLTIRQSVDLIRSVAEALHEVHRFGIVHRDLTPRNLMFHAAEREQIKIVDFGIARQQRVAGPTRTGIAVGSPGYMAPEQVRGEKILDARSDIFAIGCILYHCLTGRAPFVGDPFALPIKVLMSDPLAVAELNVDVSPELSGLVSRMLEKTPVRRPGTAAEVASALGALREADSVQRRRSQSVQMAPTTSVSSRPTPPPPSTSQGKERHDFLILIGIPEAPLPETIDVPSVLDSALAPFQGERQRLEDGTIVVRLKMTALPNEAAERAAQCALAIRAAMPGAPMVLVGESAKGSDFNNLVDRAATTLASEAMDSIFAGVVEELPTGEVIRVDELTERLLAGRADVIRAKTGFYLRGSAS
jgi:serine/threonine protein kinase